jgi:2'-5' RNA ligase
MLTPGYDPATFRKTRDRLKGRQLDELTLGILGLGRVGKRVARIGSAGFGMRVIYNDLVDPGPLPFEARPCDKTRSTASRCADHPRRHAPRQRKPRRRPADRDDEAGAILLNASRGEVLDTHALADALRSSHLAAAAIDVYAPEPPPANLELIGMPNGCSRPTSPRAPPRPRKTWPGSCAMSWPYSKATRPCIPRRDPMPFSFELHFDPETCQAVQSIWQALGQADPRQNGTAPHITLAVAQSLDLKDFSNRLEDFARQVAPFKFSLDAIGQFPSGVLFFRPHRSQALDTVHQIFHHTFQLPPAPNSHFYLPENWQPHCTLATNVPPSRMTQAIAIAQRLPLPLTGEFRDLIVVQWPQVAECLRCRLGVRS